MEKAKIKLSDSGAKLSSSTSNFLEKTAYAFLMPLPLLLPFFFVPSLAYPMQFGKMILVSLCVLFAFAFWIVARLKDGKFEFPNTPVVIAGGAIFLVTLISGLFSDAVRTSLFGQSIEVGTVASLGVSFLLLFLVSLLFHTKNRIFYAYLTFFVSFVLVSIFFVSRLFMGPSFFGFGIFQDITSNMVGGWNDLAVFFGVGIILSMITLELVDLSKFVKILTYVSVGLSLTFLAVINFLPVWYVVALFSLIFLVYTISFNKSIGFASEGSAASTTRNISPSSLTVLLISFAFILGGSWIGPAIADTLNITQVEARPSWASTFSIVQSVLSSNLLLGAGPNRFAENWNMFKPDGINSTVFWNTDFNFGIGFIPTFFVTTGLMGAIAWIVFLALFVYLGFKAVLSSVEDRVSRYIIASSFFTSLFLWIIDIFYIPGSAMVMLTFFFTGLFIAALFQSKKIKVKVVSFVDDPKKGFVSVLTLILLLIGAISVGYAFVEKYVAAVYFQKGVIAYNTEGKLDKAESYLNRAVVLDDTSSYFRSLTQIDMLRMTDLFSAQRKASEETIKTQFPILLASALDHAQRAVSVDSSNYQNWISLGGVYEALVPLKIANANAYKSADTAYQQALKLNPRSPAILLTLGRLEASNGDNSKAKEYVGRALQQKNNYTDAIFLLAQIQIQDGNIKDAIDSVQAASILAPNDSGTFFQLGFLRYNYKDYKGSVSALKRAVTLNPAYANAKYFLGLSYQKIGQVQDAIVQFNQLKLSNPDNKEIDLILSNLNAGRDPFANAAPPIDNHPEKRAVPPVVEKSSKKKTTSPSTPQSGESGTGVTNPNL